MMQVGSNIETVNQKLNSIFGKRLTAPFNASRIYPEKDSTCDAKA
jgi:hypothetical protein